jgi:hypothetical protein
MRSRRLESVASPRAFAPAHPTHGGVGRAGGAPFVAYGFTQMLEAALLLSTFASGVLKRTPAVA